MHGSRVTFRWPYGRRPQSLPVWAHHRGKSYGYVMMGGKCSPSCPPDFPRFTFGRRQHRGLSRTGFFDGELLLFTIGLAHPEDERRRRGELRIGLLRQQGLLRRGQKLCPIRLVLICPTTGGNDSPDVKRFSLDNDVAAVSGATPANGKLIDPIRWYADSLIPDADYDLYVEVGIEGDFNAYWPHWAKPLPSRTPSGITLAKIHLASRASSTRSRFDSTRAVASPPSPNILATATTRARAARSIRPT
jgi:hypothetical protein